MVLASFAKASLMQNDEQGRLLSPTSGDIEVPKSFLLVIAVDC